VIANISHIHVFRRIYSNARWILELSISCTFRAPLCDKCAIAVEFFDTVVVKIAHIHIPRRVYSNTSWTISYKYLLNLLLHMPMDWTITNNLMLLKIARSISTLQVFICNLCNLLVAFAATQKYLSPPSSSDWPPIQH
jgi:hypothetical protein